MAHPVRSHLRRAFLTGLLFLAPVGATLWVLWAVFGAIDGLLGPYIGELLGRRIPGLGLVGTVLIVYVIGVLASNVVGRRLIATWDQVVGRLPLVRTVYKVTREVARAFEGERAPFREVVAIEFPRREMWVLGFLTTRVPDGQGAPAGSVYVFVPTTPNPTSGWLVLVPEADIRRTDLSVEEGMRVIVSAGITSTPAAPAAA